MVEAMVLGGLRRVEVLGVRLDDLKFGERRVFIAEGKGGHHRIVAVSGRDKGVGVVGTKHPDWVGQQAPEQLQRAAPDASLPLPPALT